MNSGNRGYASADAPGPAKAPSSPGKYASNDSEFGAEETEEDRKREDEIRAKAVSNKRRCSFSAESANDAEIKNFKCPSFPKSPADKKKIGDALKANSKMQILGIDRCQPADFDELVMAFKEGTVSQNQDVIKQGDQGDCLYIVNEGDFDIFVARQNDDGSFGAPSKVATFGPGSLFGELSIMYSAPRAATVRCVSPAAKVWSLDRKSFQMMLKRCGVQMVEQYSGWLTEVDVLKCLNSHEISKLADACESELLDADTVIMQQGDEGDAFYILEEGSCVAFINGPSGEQVVKTYEKQGEYFGELALINNAPRKASVKTTSDSSVLKITKEQFVDLLGPINDRLKDLASKYPAIAAALEK
jgi:cAMP-dependent protein kinase regulator